MRILGLDPSLRSTGYGVIDVVGPTTFKVVAYGIIRNAGTLRQTECLVKIHESLEALIIEHSPTVAAVEAVIYLQNYRTAIILGAARAAAILAISRKQLPIFEYAPRRVKLAATGMGGAQKQQVGFMMRAVLGLTANPPADAADALAVAVTHAQSKKGLSLGTQI